MKSDDTDDTDAAVETPPKSRAVEVLAVHAVLLFFSSIMLDGGVLFDACFIPIAAFWGSVLVMACRVRFKLGTREVRYINRAWLVIVPLGICAVMYVRDHWYAR